MSSTVDKAVKKYMRTVVAGVVLLVLSQIAHALSASHVAEPRVEQALGVIGVVLFVIGIAMIVVGIALIIRLIPCCKDTATP